MGRFSSKVSAATKQRSSNIKVNPYELPEKALAVIANICTKQNQDDTSVIYEALEPVLYSNYQKDCNFIDFIDNNRKDFSEIDFFSKFDQLMELIEIELSAHENTKDTQIVVAGGFSAGKSSFLNTITGVTNLLPTGIEPVSMISTYLYLSDNINNVVVKGVNQKNAVVLLDKDVLQCIQHSSKSKVYLASVLSKLFVEVPSFALRGLAFIDTPGYNNSDKANESNGQSDQTTATNAFADGNVLFWVVDIENGTVPSKDKEMIHQFLESHEGNGKVVIIFNKADKKPEKEIRNIVDLTAREYSLGSDPAIIDVLAYSCEDNKIHYSKKGYSLPALFNEVRKAGKGTSRIDSLIKDIEELFDNEINHAEERKQMANIAKNQNIERYNESHKFYMNDKDGCKEYCDVIYKYMITSYNGILEGGDKLFDICDKILDKWSKFHDQCLEHRNEWDHVHSEYFDNAINTSADNINYLRKQYGKISYNYILEDERKDWVDRIRTELEHLNTLYKRRAEDYEQKISETKEELQQIITIINGLKFYKDAIISTLKRTINQFQYSAHQPQDARLHSHTHNDIFRAISSGKYSEFMDCFTNGVNLSDYSAEGYSPLTYAVKEGAIDMVRFFIEHNADIRMQDKNGYNAFHTALLYGYQNICQLLIEEDPSIVTTQTADGQTAAQLASQNKFNNWLKTIDL
ncbi:MAG: ankyrin repeat domain-containing protein [Lachnospiraceae bacterium]|nr:ankyrin repeat domain-containing protein [Lachnospiraceae bacterium]